MYLQLILSILVLKGEPEDLTHLAPIAGDECVPLNVPLLDDLLKSFDQANMEYALNGFFIDVDTDELPLFNLDSLPKPVDNYEMDTSKDKSFLADTASPLFLNSDPHMGLTSNSQTTSLSSPMNSDCGSDSSGYISELPFSGYEHEAEDSRSFIPVKNTSSGPNTCFQPKSASEVNSTCSAVEFKSKIPEDLSEFTAPYISVDGNEDFPLLYTATDFLWPPELNL